MKITLAGVVPINKKIQDSYVWDPSGGKFTVKSGYKFLQPNNNLENWNLRSAVWKNECLPKIKFFAWTLLNGKILTAENLRKKGIQGPSMWCLCRKEEESSQNLFLDCAIARHCWQQIISPLKLATENFDQLTTLNRNWEKCYPYTKQSKYAIIRIWKCLPSALCWQIWLSRNSCIFKNQKPNPGLILAKT